MPTLRSRPIAALLFMMISIGQAYSLSLLYNLKGSGMPQNDVSRYFHPDKTSEDAPNDVICSSKWVHHIQSNPFPARPHTDAFQIQSEPFLISRIEQRVPSHFTNSVLVLRAKHKNFLSQPDSPPPKTFI